MKCPVGHESQSTDYCDICGAVMGAPPEQASAASASPDGSGPGPSSDASGGTAGSGEVQACPSCQAENAPDALFCESCGYDFTTGTMPRSMLDLDAPTPAESSAATSDGDAAPNHPDQDDAHDAARADSSADADSGGQVSDGPVIPDSSEDADDEGADAPVVAVKLPDAPTGTSPTTTAPKLTSPWVAEVWIDPAWYRDQGSPDPMPSPGPPTIIHLAHTSILIGRVSSSRGISPDIDCGVDNGVSRRHAQLTTDGTRWWVEDLGSANGTWVGDVVGELPSAPIQTGQKREVDDDDRIYLGSWTRIVIRTSTQDEIAALA